MIKTTAWAALAASLWALAHGAPQSDQKTGSVVFKAEVDQVVLYATVYDKDGQLVTGLGRDDFRVYEERVEQQIDYFSVGDVPSTIGLVMDVSGSMKGKMDMVNQAAEIFLSLNNPSNELFLMAFNSDVSLEEPMTRDVEDVRDGLYNLVVSGGTALYDAVYLAVEQARKGSEPRKTVIVFTDGEDKDSYYTHEELLEKVQEEDVQIYLVAFLDEDLEDDGGFFGVFKSEREKVTQDLKAIADGTGGKAFFPAEAKDLSEVFKTIAFELKNQYLLAYISSNPNREKRWRPVRVTVEEAREKGLRVRAKKGYYAP